MMRFSRWIWFVFVGMVALATFGCGDDHSSVEPDPVDSTCEPGVVRCSPEGEGEVVETCSEDGSAWVFTEECQDPHRCHDGECGMMDDPACEPGTLRCDLSAGDIVEQCDEDGLGWEPVRTCEDTERCQDGQCLATSPQDCVPGSIRCAGGDRFYDVCAADGTTWEEGSVCAGDQICQDDACAPLPHHEQEAADERGANDHFATSQPIPLGVDFQAHIGAAGDEDWFRFTVDGDGVVVVNLDFSESFEAMGIAKMVVASYTDWFLESNTAVAGSIMTNTACSDYGTSQWCRSSAQFTQSVSAEVGTYFLMVTGNGYTDSFVHFPGFDPVHPYTLRVDFTPGPTLESDQPVVDGIEVGAADTWMTAHPIQFDEGDMGRAQIRSFGYYWNDIDWYTFRATQNGWVRLVADVRPEGNGEDEDYALEWRGELYYKNAAGMHSTGLSFSASGPPNCPVYYNESSQIRAGRTYYLRTASFGFSQSQPYTLDLEYRPGQPDSDQPGPVGPSNSAADAHDLGVVSHDQPVSASSYHWHHFDFDWYQVQTPPGEGGVLDILLDSTPSYQSYGTWDRLTCSEDPFGMQVWMYLYDDHWFEEGTWSLSDHLIRSTERDSPTQHIRWEAEPEATYYIMVSSREGWDQENPYTITVGLDRP